MPDHTTFTIIGHNERGEVITETFSSDVFDDPLVQELGYVIKEKYATLGIDLDAELLWMGEIGNKHMIDWYAFWTGGPVRRLIFQHMKRVIRFCDNFFESLEAK